MTTRGQSFGAEIMREARGLARLQRRAAELRADLRTTTAAIKHAKKTLRALVAAGTIPPPADWDERGPASKIHGTKAGE
jgi:hypothetical protein